MGEKDRGQYNVLGSPPAVCGALMICQLDVLSRYEELFDPLFVLYKEDIELSLRLRRDGFALVYNPRLVAFHCRGWRSERKKMELRLRLMASRNEILLYKKHPSPYIIWAILKYFLVRLFRV
jgi:GT2 family glycosyltransferase